MPVEDIGQVVVHRADNVLVALSVAIDVILGPQHLLGLGDRDPDGNPVAGVRTLRGSNVKTVGLEPGLYEVDRVGVRCNESCDRFLGEVLTIPVAHMSAFRTPA